MKSCPGNAWPLLIVLLMTSLYHTAAFSQPAPPDSAALVAFFDGLIPAHLKDEHIAGATVAVVRDGRLLFAKGYGYADLAKQQPVQPDRTMFRIGSISKLFVWTAVMQLVQQGKLDLDADVNTYLKEFKVPDTYAQPITLKHLMTHSAGFEDQVIGLFAKSADRVRSLGEILAEELPGRVRPPGEVSSYSNHGTGLAAYIVEQVSGQEFNDYVEEHILGPLGMSHTTFRQPLPAGLAPDMSKGYNWEGGKLNEKEFEYVPLAPVGAAASTATDIARFMLAHLQLGAFNDTTILDSATTRLMHSEAFRHAPGVNPMAYGFFTLSRNGQWVIGHGGDTFWFHSLMVILPDTGTGLFVSFNSAGGGGVYAKVFEEFMDYLYPYTIPDDRIAAPGDLERFAGVYRGNRFSHSTLARLAALMGPVTIGATDDGRLKVSTDSETDYFVPTGPLSFRKEHGQQTLVFRENTAGRVTHFFLGDLPILAFEPVPAAEQMNVQMSIFVGAAIIFLLTLIGWTTGAWLRRRYRVRANGLKLLPAGARWLGWFTALIFVVFYLAFAAAMSDPVAIAFGIPATLKTILLIPFLAMVLTAVLLVTTIRIWLKRQGRWTARLYFSLLTLACLAALWQLYQWNMIGS